MEFTVRLLINSIEHHVHLGELKNSWGRSMNGTVGESLELFSNLRKKGIPAHYWP